LLKGRNTKRPETRGAPSSISKLRKRKRLREKGNKTETWKKNLFFLVLSDKKWQKVSSYFEAPSLVSGRHFCLSLFLQRRVWPGKMDTLRLPGPTKKEDAVVTATAPFVMPVR
jgi:hypothetical protein